MLAPAQVPLKKPHRGPMQLCALWHGGVVAIKGMIQALPHALTSRKREAGNSNAGHWMIIEIPLVNAYDEAEKHRQGLRVVSCLRTAWCLFQASLLAGFPVAPLWHRGGDESHRGAVR